MEKMTVAVIDMGSNSFRLQISEVVSGTYIIKDDYKEVLRIGDIVYATGGFTEEAMKKVLATLKRMRIFMDNSKVSAYRLVGTAPFRDANNADELLKRVKDELGFDIDIITGEEEARLTYLAASGYFNVSDIKALFVDIGGGSTELSHSVDGELKESVSTPLGCSRITYNFIQKNKAKSEEVTKLKKHIDAELAKVMGDFDIDRLVFTGGTVNSLAQVYVRRSNMADSMVKYVDATFLNHLVNELAGKSYDDRAKIPGLEAERADISLAAAMIVQALLEHYKLSGFYSFSGGLRNGITIELLNRMGVELLFQQENQLDVRYLKLVETGRKYNYEEGHALQVTMLCKKLFDALKKELKLKDEDWLLLEAAAILHDIGQHISYADHHKHSSYMIRNTEMVDYSLEQQEIIANIARYHRSGQPKQKHKEFHELPSHDQKKVELLAGILRVADGLDRTHTSAVHDLGVVITKKEVQIKIFSNKNVDMELTGASKKKDLLEAVMDKQIILE
jgi:exopolyphosphatase/guanosine-5'-triphosphate,3'-diphosphate pyrophosphatase